MEKVTQFKLEKALVIWAVIRLPLLAIILYLLLDLSLTELTVPAIKIISTLQERMLVFAIVALVLSLAIFLSHTLRAKKIGYLLPLIVAFGLFLIIFQIWPAKLGFSSETGSIKAVILTGLLAINTIPDSWAIEWISTGRGKVLSNYLFSLGIGLTEFFLPKPFLLWLLTRINGRSQVVVRGAWRWLLDLLPVVILSAFLALFLLDNSFLIKLGRVLHQDPSVQILRRGSINGLAFNKELKLLYLSGHSENHILAYNVNALEQVPRQSTAETDRAQGFFYNPRDKEIYVHNETQKALLILNADTLNLTRSIPLPAISPGDSWVVWDKFSDNIIIASEADEKINKPLVIVNRTTGKIVYSSDLYPSFLLLNPEKPILYMNFFRRITSLIAFDTLNNQVLKEVPTDKHVDRMAFVKSTNELLETAPIKSSILRYDADTLKLKGAIATTFGVRGIAVDESRNLVLGASLATNMLNITDLKTGKHLAEYRLGPWLREICLDTDSGIAYVSSNGALYKVNYLSKLK